MKPWTGDEIRRVGYRVVDLIAKHLTEIDDEPAFAPVPREVAERTLSTPAPADAQSADDILREFSETIEPYPFGNGHPRFWGWINSPPAVMGVFAKDVGLMSGSPRTLIVHSFALVFVAAFSFFGSWLLYKVTDLIIPLRVSSEQEEIGLDLSQHGEVMQDALVAPFQRILAKSA